MANRWVKNENSERLYFRGGSKITADGDFSHEIKRRLLLGRKTMTNLDSILKSRHISLPTKVHLVKATVFPVVMYGCENWTIKKAECWRIDAFELWCWRRLLRVPWTARRSDQSILKEISPEYSLEGLMLKLNLQYFGHLMWTDTLEKTLMLGEIEGRRRRGQQRMRWLDGITDMSLSKVWSWWWTEKSIVLQPVGSQGVGHDSDWTEDMTFTLTGQMYWSRKWLPTPMFLPGKFHGQWDLAGCSSTGRKQSDTTKYTVDRLGVSLGQNGVWMSLHCTSFIFSVTFTLTLILSPVEFLVYRENPLESLLLPLLPPCHPSFFSLLLIY